MMFSFLCHMYFCEFVVLYSGANYDDGAPGWIDRLSDQSSGRRDRVTPRRIVRPGRVE